MRSRELQSLLASMTGRLLNEIDQRVRGLRSAGKISTGPRGVHAPHVDTAEALFHILTLVARRNGDAFEVAGRLLNECHLVPHPDFPGLGDIFVDKESDLSSALLLTMSDHWDVIGFEVKSFEFQEDGNYAWMNFNRRSLKNLRFMFSTNKNHWELDGLEAAELYDAIDKKASANRFVIGADHLRFIGEQVSIDAPVVSGEGDDDAV